MVVTPVHPELPFCGSHGYLSFGLWLRHAETACLESSLEP